MEFQTVGATHPKQEETFGLEIKAIIWDAKIVISKTPSQVFCYKMLP